MTRYELITHKINLLYLAFSQARCETMRMIWATKLNSMMELQYYMPVDIAAEQAPLGMVK